jgi:hypothetical protein
MTTNNTDFRKNNGIILLEQGNVVRNNENNYIVVSQTSATSNIPLNFWKMYGFARALTLNTVKLKAVNISTLSNFL